SWTSTWPGPGSGRGTSTTLSTSTPPYSSKRTAFGMTPSVLPARLLPWRPLLTTCPPPLCRVARGGARGGEVPALASGCYGVADVAVADVAVPDVVAVEVGVGVGGSVAGGLVACGVTVCLGVAVRCGDGVTVGVGEWPGVRRGAGRFVC